MSAAGAAINIRARCPAFGETGRGWRRR
jgi:hypothetical protein